MPPTPAPRTLAQVINDERAAIRSLTIPAPVSSAAFENGWNTCLRAMQENIASLQGQPIPEGAGVDPAAIRTMQETLDGAHEFNRAIRAKLGVAEGESSMSAIESVLAARAADAKTIDEIGRDLDAARAAGQESSLEVAALREKVTELERLLAEATKPANPPAPPADAPPAP